MTCHASTVKVKSTCWGIITFPCLHIMKYSPWAWQISHKVAAEVWQYGDCIVTVQYSTVQQYSVTVSWLGNLATMKPPSTHRPLHIVTSRTPAAQHCNGEGSLNLQPFIKQAFKINLLMLDHERPKTRCHNPSHNNPYPLWGSKDLKYRVSSFHSLILKSRFMNSP